MKYIIIIYLFFSENTWARSLKATADKLAKETERIGMSIALFGLVLAAIYFILGKQDASTKLTQVIWGVIILSTGSTIINFIRGLA